MSNRASIALVMLVVSCAAACSTGLKIDRHVDASVAVDADVMDAFVEDAFVVDAELVEDALVEDAFVVDAALVDATAGAILCEGADAAVPSSSIVAPDLAAYLAAIGSLPSTGASWPGRFQLDPAMCVGVLWQIGLPLGSAFVNVVVADNGDCEVWLGGEEENPEYNGLPYQYCRFSPRCVSIELAFEMDDLGGGAQIDSPWCVPTGFCTEDSCPR